MKPRLFNIWSPFYNKKVWRQKCFLSQKLPQMKKQAKGGCEGVGVTQEEYNHLCSFHLSHLNERYVFALLI